MIAVSAPTYVIITTQTVTTAGTHLIELRVPITCVVAIVEAWLGIDTIETSEQARFRISRFATQGSTGTSLTVEPVQTGFATAVCTAVFNPGTPPSGAQRIFDTRPANVLGGGYDAPMLYKGVLVGPGLCSISMQNVDALSGSSYTFGMTIAELRG
jgi:hypothetical protein